MFSRHHPKVFLAAVVLASLFGSLLNAAPAPAQGTACSPVNATIAAPFYFDGAGTFCWQSNNLGGYINSWNLTSLTVNGVNFTNVYVPSSSYPAQISGYWYVAYNGPYPWSHFEAAGTGGTPVPTATATRTNTPGGATNTPTRTPTRTNTPGGPTNTPTRTNTPGGPTNTPTRTPTRTNTPGGPTNTPTRTPTRTPTTGGGGANTMGFIGCSMAENTAQGYRAIGGTRMWGPYGTGSLVVQSWTDTNSSAWQKFDQQVASFGMPTAVWVQICIFAQNGATYNEVKQMIANARQHAASGATIYITGQPLYEPGHTCSLAGAGGPELTDSLAQQAAGDPTQNVIYPGVFRLLNSEVVSDGCHANTAGQQSLGQQAKAFWN